MYNCCTNNGCGTGDTALVNAFRRGFDAGLYYGAQQANETNHCCNHCNQGNNWGNWGNWTNGCGTRRTCGCYNVNRRCGGFTTYPVFGRCTNLTNTVNTVGTTFTGGCYTGGYGNYGYNRNGGCGCGCNG